MTPKKTVVVVGASWAGIKTTHAILKNISDVKVILVNPSSKHFFNIAAPRILAKPDAFKPDQYIFDIPELFQKYNRKLVSFVQGVASSIDVNQKTVTVTVADVDNKEHGESIISYDYLVIASGSTTWATRGQSSVLAPFKTTGSDAMQTTIEQAQKAISEAKTVVVGGAGAVGVEFCGELAEAFHGKKDKSITLLTRTDRILPTLKPTASKKAHKILSGMGVNIRTSTAVSSASQDPSSKKWTVTLEGGETITADVYISTTGVVPNSDFVPADLKDNDGWVSVDAEFRVKRKNGTAKEKLPIYAVGDITTHTPRMLLKVDGQVSVLVANLHADIEKLKGKRSQYSESDKTIMLVPIGSRSGTGQIWFFVVWGWLVALLKGRDYFLSRADSELM
ncbi:apoptosis-inducing factor 1 [Histoplasma capsulatum G186AR]|uniref:Apoptosis-inducing factor 1 n=2 Tax=Ajellomyces capsulatus TaxID=5037 RepID=C0NTD3_AJECG|nr:apoptosis-inducing factor 1 [Histoplasma capsulatum G186AR]EEH05294.1 apoptosis-inducing factor 1 [Histoplasma capsulatum G186AR]KAG5305334.1 apoptosis-inducing factor 1 [Histoplasma capsulatum]QSS76295.1 apoptosis-inducing factor 1 [Histoplasma capsulatum G186AR]